MTSYDYCDTVSWNKMKTKVIIKIVPVTEAFELAFWMTWQHSHSLPLQRYRSFYQYTSMGLSS